MSQLRQRELDFTALSSFDKASRVVLNYLQHRLGFGLWMTTRTNLSAWIVLAAADRAYDVQSGRVFKWADSFCSRMVKGEGPHIALNADDIPAYAAAEIGRQVPIASYIGVPMRADDGSLYGTLCAIDPSPQFINADKELPQIQLLARLLSGLLEKELVVAKQEREMLRLRQDADHDSLTGLLNRRGWDAAIAREQSRCDRYGSPMAIFIFDLDELKITNDTEGHGKGDALIRKTAQCLLAAVRASDVVARIGGDEFGVMAVECTSEISALLLDKLRALFSAQGIRVSVGKAMHEPGRLIAETVKQADREMYEMKRLNRSWENVT